MKFRNRPKEEPEINLIPFIDVLLVIIIFLLLTTTYNQISVLQIRLPQASLNEQNAATDIIHVDISADGLYAINSTVMNNPTIADLAQRIKQIAQGSTEAVVVINADGNASHQTVINAMDAIKQAGLPRLTFATRTSAPAP